MSNNLLFERSLKIGTFRVFNEKPEHDILKTKQIHSNIVLSEENVTNTSEGDGITGHNLSTKTILTADCMPIIIIGKHGHATIHAGWRGLHSEILLNEKVRALEPYYAFFGPHIKERNYEVQPDFLANFPNYLSAFSTKEEKIFFSLDKVASAQLLNAYPGIEIEDSQICTFENQNYNSYRRNQTTQRNWNCYYPE